ncbi:GYF domain-containing protein [Mycena venus]|uniref:GYF domain-containing protein n=1 Tax=Mycena venus TaxID=2733690 RepID=A0A8H6XG41_9AGAR|nr:GYF domain-containing protein [Mycena venus]
MADDEWHDTQDDIIVYEAPMGIQQVDSDAPASAELDKIVSQVEENGPSPHDSSRGPSLSTTTEHLSDTASVHSMPAVMVTEPDSQHARRASTLQQTTQVSPPPASPTRASPEPSLTSIERRNRHRSAVEVRSSNRLSGFFTNLIHRRDGTAHGAPRSPIREERPPQSPLAAQAPVQSRSPSPTPARPVTPPPRLPPPTLHELGLSLNVLTADLSPSHFSTPPTSGAFLSPHYLLLCHAQGLDVLPLFSPPVSQPYALVRRVSFKSVVVMEQRGVLVAIAGRRDGVRVYALEEIKKAVEWRMDVEIRRERDRQRREAVKKRVCLPHPPGEPLTRGKLPRKSSHPTIPNLPPPPSPTPPAPLVPRTPTTRRFKSPRATPPQPAVPEPSGRPPPYSSPSEAPAAPPTPPQPAPPLLAARQSRSRAGSVTNVLAAAPMSRRPTTTPRPRDPDSKGEWVESSDDEAINVVAAGASGSQALDERTSVRLSANLSLPSAPPTPAAATDLTQALSPSTSRRGRPANLDLTLSMPAPGSQIVPSEPSPTPTLLTLRQALSHSPSGGTRRQLPDQDPDTPFFGDLDEEDDEDNGQISLAEALMESRLPDLPPAGTRQPQQPILFAAGAADDEPASPRTSEHSVPTQASHTTPSAGRRRRWSVLIGQALVPSSSEVPATVPAEQGRPPISRSHSYRSSQSVGSTVQQRPSTASAVTTSASSLISPSVPDNSSHMSASSSRSSRFIPRIISNAFHARRDDRPPLPALQTKDHEVRRTGATPTSSHMPPPKLEYVKLPGTKGALTIKSVETAKKRCGFISMLTYNAGRLTRIHIDLLSFLAILCGENGEKVELFAGTYRTALGLSRTFILPDSPRLLELQLQGDDLVEVFLVFGQNVFGLEPATVRVREVRIGRAERRAARRRAREVRAGESAGDQEGEAGEDNTNVNVSIGVSVAVGSTVVATGSGVPDQPGTPTLVAGEHPDQGDGGSDPNGETANEPTTTVSHAEELVALATARMGPYTTFQQLSFAPKFPLASIADEYIIPPTYPDFLEYRTEHEPEASGSNSTDLTQIQFSPPGLPVPAPTAPSKWYYRDPKNNIHGPWKASLMQAWYKDGLLPPDLPVRREEDTEYVLLKDLRLQSVDPALPFLVPPPPAQPSAAEQAFTQPEKPLLSPISLLAQPRHFGPPALFFSTRGGHSTAIVDARGRSVLKGRFVWSDDAENEGQGPDAKPAPLGRMGDVKRLEAFDVKDRSVLVAMRQGGLEAVDLSDALLKPADESRTVLPQFSPPPSNINRRGPFVWKIGTPVATSSTSATVLSSKAKRW